MGMGELDIFCHSDVYSISRFVKLESFDVLLGCRLAPR
jgi:hypothetical protein